MVDGERGFLWLADAVAWADDGATIELCEGELDEQITLTRPVSLVGPGGNALTWSGTADTPPLTLDGADPVVLSGVTLQGEGDGLHVGAGSRLLAENVLMEVSGHGVLVTEAEVSLDHVTWSGGSHGVLAEGGTLELSGGRLDGTEVAGIVALGAERVHISDTLIVGDQELLYREDDPEAWADEAGGIVVSSDGEVTLDGVVVSDHHARGVHIAGQEARATLVANEVTILDVGRYGLHLSQVDGSLTEVDVEGLRLVDDPELVNQGYDTTVGFGVLIEDSELSWTGGTLTDSELVGLYATGSTVALDSLDLSGHAEFGLWSEDTDLHVAQSTFQAGSPSGSVYAGSGDVVLTSNLFVDNLEGESFEVEDDDGSVLIYEYTNYSVDVVAASVSSLWLTDNEFSNGSFGVRLYASEGVVIEDNTWHEYHRNLLYLYGVDDPVQLRDNRFEDSAGFMVHCFYSAIDIESLEISGQIEHHYEDAYYQDGEYIDGSTSSFWELAIYADSCELSMRESTLTEVGEHPLQVVDSSLVLEEVEIDSSSQRGTRGEGVVQALFERTPADVSITGLSVSNAAVGTALHIADSTGEPGQVSLSGLELSGGGAGLVLDGVDGAQASGLHVSDSRGVGLWATGSLSLEESSLSGHAEHGLEWVGGTLSLDGVEATGNGGHGLSLTGTEEDSATLSDTSASGNAQSGLWASGLSLTLQDCALTDNNGVGLYCDEAEVATCESVDLSDNTAGESEGCSLTCD